MCLGVPGLVVAIDEDDGILMGKVDFGGVAKRVCLDHVREVAVGEWVLVHVGFALTRIDEAEARRFFEMLEAEELAALAAEREPT